MWLRLKKKNNKKITIEFKLELSEKDKDDIIIDGTVVSGTDCGGNLRLFCEEAKNFEYHEKFVVAAETLGCIIRDIRYLKRRGADTWYWSPWKIVLQRGDKLLIIRRKYFEERIVEKDLPPGSRVVTDHNSKVIRGETVFYEY